MVSLLKSFLIAEFTVDPFADPSMLTNPLGEPEEVSVSQLPEGTEDDNTVKPSGIESDTDQMNMLYHEGKDQNKVSVSSLEKKGILLNS